MSELLVQHTELSSDPYDKLTAKVLELVGMQKEPQHWSVVLNHVAETTDQHVRQAAHRAIWHAVKNGLVVADDNNFLQLSPKSGETIETV